MRRRLTLLAALAVALAPIALEAKPGRGNGHGGQRAERNEGRGGERHGRRGGGRSIRIIIANPEAETRARDGGGRSSGEGASVIDEAPAWPIAVALRPVARPEDLVRLTLGDDAEPWSDDEFSDGSLPVATTSTALDLSVDIPVSATTDLHRFDESVAASTGAAVSLPPATVVATSGIAAPVPSAPGEVLAAPEPVGAASEAGAPLMEW